MSANNFYYEVAGVSVEGAAAGVSFGASMVRWFSLSASLDIGFFAGGCVGGLSNGGKT